MNRNRALAGRNALVTGAARRIGAELARELAAAGANVAVHYRNSRDEAEATAAAIRELGVAAVPIRADLAESGAARELAAAAAAELGPIDILVNNASIFGMPGSMAEDLAGWDANHEIHVRAPLRLSMELSAGLPEGREGDIVNLNDWRALRPAVDNLSYTLSKSALHDQTRALALRLAPRVRVNEIALGAVLPPEKASDEYMHTLREEIPLRRFPRVRDVCAALVFLLTTPSITGQTICVDGGRHLV